MYGYMGKLLFVDLSTGEIEVRPLKNPMRVTFLAVLALEQEFFTTKCLLRLILLVPTV
jgi:aldehyde:ferredoxin oxidoreductase